MSWRPVKWPVRKSYLLPFGIILGVAVAVACSSSKSSSKFGFDPHADSGLTTEQYGQILNAVQQVNASTTQAQLAAQGQQIFESKTIGKKGDSHVVAGATPLVVSGKLEGRLPGDHRDVMTILMIVAIDDLMLSVRTESPFKTIDDAISIANSTDYGLSSAVCTNRLDWITRFVSELHVGSVNVREVPGYPPQISAYRRAFERDKEMLRGMGVPITMEVAGTDTEVGYRVRPEDYYLPDLGLDAEESAALRVAVSAVSLGSHAGEGNTPVE